MKVIPVEQAMQRLPAICQAALAGEVIRVQAIGGAQLELTPVAASHASLSDLSDKDLAAAYDDPEWASFENNCAKSSD